jgi:hypothetical protein
MMAERATDISKLNRAREAAIFEMQMEAFFKRWAPPDVADAAQFHAQLVSLIRRTYEDAQAPLFKHIETLINALPPILRVPQE